MHGDQESREPLGKGKRCVATGADGLVTDRDRQHPPRPAKTAGAALIAEAGRAGLITPASLPPGAPPPMLPPGAMTLDELLADLDRSRTDR
jgi:hypothetical protein